MNQSNIGLYRLSAQRISGTRCETPAAAVKHMLAMQAQDYNGALWSAGLRTQRPSKNEVEKSIRDRKIIRTWPMRGTLHFLHADDVQWMLKLLAPRATAAARSRRINQLGLTDEVVAEGETVLRDALRGRRSVVRTKVADLLRENVKSVNITGQHVQHLMRNFGERGVICFGPNDGKQPTFVLLDEWVPPGREKPREEALEELARRYFLSHGPATLKDFSGWGMLTVADAKAGIAGAEKDLAATTVENTVYYHDPIVQPADGSDAFLLPGFDEFLLGYKDRSAVLAPEHADKIVPGGNGMFLATVVEKGHVTGLWTKKIAKSGVTFDYTYFAKKQLSTAASEHAYQEFLSH